MVSFKASWAPSSAFAITRNVFTSVGARRSTLVKYWWLVVTLCITLALGGFTSYQRAVDWWNHEVYLKRQVAAIDTTDPVLTQALVKWIKTKSTGIPNTHPDMLEQILVTAFVESDVRQVDPLLTLAVIATESQFNYMATSPAGAKGLMQVIPYWHQDKISAVEVYNPVANIRAGTKILREYLNLSNGDVNKALLRYNGSLQIPGANYDTKVLKTRAELSKFIETQMRNTYGKTS